MTKLLLGTIAVSVLVASCNPAPDYRKQFATLKPNVVHIRSSYAGEKSSATGWLMADGMTIMTAKHVLYTSDGKLIPAQNFTLTFIDGRTVIPKSEKCGTEDIAVFSLSSKLKGGLQLGKKNGEVGTQVFALGWCEWDDDATFAVGHISSYTEHGHEWRMQLQSEALPGNSGSPVINERGEVIGLLVSVRWNTDSYVYCLPLDTLLKELPLLK